MALQENDIIMFKRHLRIVYLSLNVLALCITLHTILRFGIKAFVMLGLPIFVPLVVASACHMYLQMDLRVTIILIKRVSNFPPHSFYM